MDETDDFDREKEINIILFRYLILVGIVGLELIILFVFLMYFTCVYAKPPLLYLSLGLEVTTFDLVSAILCRQRPMFLTIEEKVYYFLQGLLLLLKDFIKRRKYD